MLCDARPQKPFAAGRLPQPESDASVILLAQKLGERMTTFNLITMFGDQISGIEPMVAGDRDDAVAFASGLLTERTRGHLEMFAHLRVRWIVDEGQRDLGSITIARGPVVGHFSVVSREHVLKLLWEPRPVPGKADTP